MNDTATQQGAARNESPDPDVNPDEVVVHQNPRTVALEAMAERQESMRQEELDEALGTDAGLRHNQDAIESEMRESNAAAGIVHAEGASVQPMHEESPTPQPGLPSNLQDDPLADFIEMQNGQPMVKAKVNGQDRLIPLTDAKRQVQIGVAAEVRMQNAAQAERQIQEREAQVTAGEAALQARTAQPQIPTAPLTPMAGLSDAELESEATEIFNTAFSGTEEDAAKKLAGMFVKIRDSAARQPTQQIDSNAIAQQAASLAVGEISAQSRNQDVHTGYAAFKSNYPDILEDPNLFKMADDLTETIEQENPNWTIAQVMDEAGKRTRTWVKDLRGETEDTGKIPARQPGNQNSLVSESTTQTRQERKAGLVRIPTPAAAATYREPEQSDEDAQSPTEAFLEIKKARGQPL